MTKLPSADMVRAAIDFQGPGLVAGSRVTTALDAVVTRALPRYHVERLPEAMAMAVRMVRLLDAQERPTRLPEPLPDLEPVVRALVISMVLALGKPRWFGWLIAEHGAYRHDWDSVIAELLDQQLFDGFALL